MNTATALRDLLALLNDVEQSEDGVIERRGVGSQLALDPSHRRTATASASPLIIKDPQLLDKDWTWMISEDGELRLELRRRTSSASEVGRAGNRTL